MLQNLGEDVLENLKMLAIKTTRRDVRALLLGYLAKRRVFSEDELKMVDYASMIEHLYPNPTYSQIYSNIFSKQEKIRENSQRMDIQVIFLHEQYLLN